MSRCIHPLSPVANLVVIPSIICISIATCTLAIPQAMAEPTVTVTDPVTGQPVSANNGTTSAATNLNPAVDGSSTVDPNTLAAQLQPTDNELAAANQELLSRNAKLQREINDLQTQVNVLIYESQGQLYLYGAFTVLISLLVGIFISWLVFVRRERW